MYKCLLVVPCLYDETYQVSSSEYLGLQYLGAALDMNDINNEILNAHVNKINNYDVCTYIIENGFNFIGISCLSQLCYPYAKDLVLLLRKRRYTGHICMGGFYVSLAYQNIIDDIDELDTIIVGEGEQSLPTLIKRLIAKESIDGISGLLYKSAGKSTFFEPVRIKSLDVVPFPKRDIHQTGINKSRGRFFRILAGRGCYGKCAFCSIIKHYKPRYKIYRSAKNVVDEIEFLLNKYNVHSFQFIDDIFYDLSKNGLFFINSFIEEITRRKLVITFKCELRINDIRRLEIEKLQKIGLQRIAIGVESGVDRVLNEMKKGFSKKDINNAFKILDDCGVETKSFYITVVPTMSLEELKKNYEFLFNNFEYFDKRIYNRLRVYCNSEYENILKEKGLLIKKDNLHDMYSYSYVDNRVEQFVAILEKIIDFTEKEDSKLIKECNDLANDYKNTWEKIILNIFNYIENDKKNINENENIYESILSNILN